MPVEHVLSTFPVPVPVNVTPDLVDASGERFFFLVSVYVILVYGKKSLDEEGGFHKVAAIVFLSERFHLSGVAIPPVRISSVKAVGLLEKGDDALHACQSFFTGDIAAVYSGKDSHDAEAAATGSDYVGIVFWINAVYMITFGS